MGKLIIIHKKESLVLLLMESRRAEFIRITDNLNEDSILGNIYIGKVASIMPGIHAAFVAINKDLSVFLPLVECEEAMLINRDFDGTLKQGDEVVIQITANALKTKQPSASANLTLVGHFCICSYHGHGVRYSSKLENSKRERLKKLMKEKELAERKQYGFTMRTNAGEMEHQDELIKEMKDFIACFQDMREKYRFRTCYSCLYRTEPEILKVIQDIPLGSYDEIITDLPEVYEFLSDNLVSHPDKLRFYQDELIALSKIYSVDTNLAEAAAQKVWLPSGGYLVIEPTEAMVVIDVNSGKNVGKTKKQTTLYYNINLEAAKEIARQLRIRNYSGMIMVDFINMDSEEEKKELLKRFDFYLKQDFVKTRLVDMTALGIVEVTRKKVSKPLDISLL